MVSPEQNVHTDAHLCVHVDCTSLGVFMFPSPALVPVGFMCELHKLAGMVNATEYLANVQSTMDNEPVHPSKFGYAIDTDEVHVSWDDETDFALSCNDVPQNVGPFDKLTGSPCVSDIEEENTDVLSTITTARNGPDFHHCAKHVENNLLSKFKHGDLLRENFRRAVHSFNTQEKVHFLSEIQKISPGAKHYCEDIEQDLLFRADANYPKYDVYTNQPTECLNWVLLPPRKKNRYLLLKAIESWFLKQLAIRKQAHEQRLLGGNVLTAYAHTTISASITQLSYYKTLPTNTPDIFLVETVSGHTQFTVNVHAHTCTCKRWDDYQIPCVHACRVICDSGKAVQGFVSGPFLTQNMILAYSGMFLPVMKHNLVPREGRLAPVFVVQAGRPKKRRIPSKGSREAVVRANHGAKKKQEAQLYALHVEQLGTTMPLLAGE